MSEIQKGNALYFTVKEVARYLKTNRTYVYKLIKAGLLPASKIGSYKIEKDLLYQFIADHEGMDITDPYNVRPIEIIRK